MLPVNILCYKIKRCVKHLCWPPGCECQELEPEPKHVSRKDTPAAVWLAGMNESAAVSWSNIFTWKNNWLMNEPCYSDGGIWQTFLKNAWREPVTSRKIMTDICCQWLNSSFFQVKFGRHICYHELVSFPMLKRFFLIRLMVILMNVFFW